MGVRIVWHEAGFAGIERAIQDFMEDLGERVKAAAQGLAPVDTGALRSSIQLDMEGTTAVISANTYYALYQELGTGPHTTQPWVHHPGNPAVHYLLNALAAAGG
jgi:phage gpG-like protein